MTVMKAKVALQETTSNPFCTRFVRPGAIEFRFNATASADDAHRPAEIVQQLVDHPLGLIIGPHGSGKSTLLQTLLPELRRRFGSIEHVQTHACSTESWRARSAHSRQISRETHERLIKLDRGGLLVIDGIEQMSFLGRKRLIRLARQNGQSVLGTSHHPIRPFKSIFQTTVTDRLVYVLTESLLARSPDGLSQSVLAELGRRDLSRLSNVRNLWFDLYDLAQTP